MAVVLISREMGARFTQLFLTFQTDGRAAFPSNDTESFVTIRQTRTVRLPGISSNPNQVGKKQDDDDRAPGLELLEEAG